jgi:hypothetical protein
MGKIKDVLNSISKDEKNIPRTGSKGTTDNNAPRRGSKASSKETVESVAAPVVATIDPVQENSRRLSIKTDAPILAVDRKFCLLVCPDNSIVDLTLSRPLKDDPRRANLSAARSPLIQKVKK